MFVLQVVAILLDNTSKPDVFVKLFLYYSLLLCSENHRG